MKHAPERQYIGTPYLPDSQTGFGTHEENTRRKDAEQGSRALAKAIQNYFRRRKGGPGDVVAYLVTALPKEDE